RPCRRAAPACPWSPRRSRRPTCRLRPSEPLPLRDRHPEAPPAREAAAGHTPAPRDALEPPERRAAAVTQPLRLRVHDRVGDVADAGPPALAQHDRLVVGALP